MIPGGSVQNKFLCTPASIKSKSSSPVRERVCYVAIKKGTRHGDTGPVFLSRRTADEEMPPYK